MISANKFQQECRTIKTRRQQNLTKCTWNTEI